MPPRPSGREREREEEKSYWLLLIKIPLMEKRREREYVRAGTASTLEEEEERNEGTMKMMRKEGRKEGRKERARTNELPLGLAACSFSSPFSLSTFPIRGREKVSPRSSGGRSPRRPLLIPAPYVRLHGGCPLHATAANSFGRSELLTHYTIRGPWPSFPRFSIATLDFFCSAAPSSLPTLYE